jgi:hypothetical protein
MKWGMTSISFVLGTRGSVSLGWAWYWVLASGTWAWDLILRCGLGTLTWDYVINAMVIYADIIHADIIRADITPT